MNPSIALDCQFADLRVQLTYPFAVNRTFRDTGVENSRDDRAAFCAP
jgi:hypothetical protein